MVSIAGLAMFVYMDGEYQCNRNRHNLKIPDGTTTSRQTEVNFRVRQKEAIQANGTFAGSQWKFRELNIGRHPSRSPCATLHRCLDHGT